MTNKEWLIDELEIGGVYSEYGIIGNYEYLGNYGGVFVFQILQQDQFTKEYTRTRYRIQLPLETVNKLIKGVNKNVI